MDWSDDRTQKQDKKCRVKGGYNSGMEMECRYGVWYDY